MRRKKFLSAFICLALVFTLLPTVAMADIVTVTGGTGSGEYAEGGTVTITADAPNPGKRFKEWTISPTVTFVESTSAASSTAKFTMPAGDVTITASYEDIPTENYTLYYNSTDGKLHQGSLGGAVFNGNYTGSGITLTLTDFHFTTTARNALELPVGGTTLVLYGTNTVTSEYTGTESENSDGIYAKGALTVSSASTGSLTVTGGTVTVENKSSIGIRADRDIAVEGGTLIGKGGTSNNESYGVLAYGSIKVSGTDVVLTGEGGEAAKGSYGVCAVSSIEVSDTGALNGTGGKSTTSDYGVYARSSITVSSGAVEASGNTSALNLSPDLSLGNYKYKTNTAASEPEGSYTRSRTAAYSYSSGHKYLNILPDSALAAVDTVTISGTVGIPITDTNVVITLKNDAFAPSVSGAWITNLPTGLSQSVTRTGDTTATIAVSGTPASASGAAQAITIPAEALTGNADLTVTANADAKFAIKPAAPAANVGYTINYEADTITVTSGYEVSADESFATTLTSGDTVTPGQIYYVRLAASGSIPAGAPLSFSYAKAELSNFSITGTVGTAITPVTDVRITLTGDTFTGTAFEIGQTFFTNINGLIATITARQKDDGDVAIVTISGTPTEAKNAGLTITIPASKLQSGVANITSVVNESATVKIAPYVAPSPGGGAARAPKVPVIVDGQEYNIGKAQTSQGVTTVTFDQTALQKQLDSASDAVVVPVTPGSNADTAVAQLVVANVDEMAEKEMTLSVQVDDVSYVMPAVAINTAALMTELGATDPAKVPVNVTIKELDENDVTLENGELMLPPVEFGVNASYGGKNVEVETFEKFVKRVIEVPDGVDAGKITTAVVIENGKQRHVPTEVFQKDGKWYARINSLTNSVYALINNEKSFSDAPGKWFEAIATEMASRGIIDGRDENTFDGNGNITRAEFASIIVRALGLPTDGICSFNDVKAGDWYYGAVGTAFEHDLVNGCADGGFKPNANITRQEAMAMVHRAAAITELSGTIGTLAAFSDEDSVSSWALSDAQWNVGSGLIQGNSAGKINGKKYISRGESATIILRLLQKSELVDVRTKA